MEIKLDFDKNKIANSNTWPNQPRFGRLQKKDG